MLIPPRLPCDGSAHRLCLQAVRRQGGSVVSEGDRLSVAAVHRSQIGFQKI